MIPNRLPLILAIASLMLTTACAGFRPASAPVTPPRRAMPETALRPCVLDRLPGSPTLQDLELAYTARGVALIACDEARQLAVDVHAGEHADEDAWLRVQQEKGPLP